LRIYASYKQDNWDEQLALAEFAYNNAKQASTKVSPFLLNTGRHPTLPISIEQTTVPAAEDMVERINNLIHIAQENLKKAQESQAKYANQRCREETFEPGDQVLLSTQHIEADGQRKRPSKKLQPRFIGPYKIIQEISPVAYKLELPPHLKIHPVFHVSLLQRYKANDERLFPDRVILPPPPIEVNNEEEFEVEAILDKRIKKFGKHQRTEYLVHWKGYPEHDSTWEPETNLQHAQEALEMYNRQ